jgi:ribosomal protein L37AE/L43A
MPRRTANTKRCVHCKRYLTLDHFSKLRSSEDGLQFRCKHCQKKFASSWYKRNANKLKELRNSLSNKRA